jgi:nickel-type superoxide dismutase maturation protease
MMDIRRESTMVEIYPVADAMKHWRRPLRRVQVHGDSMRPGLEPGDRLLVAGLRPRPGDIVAVVDPRDPRRVIVKRVASVDASGVTVLGDNPAASTDSRTFGSVDAALVLGRAVYRYWPERRRGRVKG